MTSSSVPCQEYSACRLCGSEKMTVLLDFGSTPLANDYKKPGESNDKFPLVVHQCGRCGSTELKYGVDPVILYRNYLYESSTSGSVSSHFKNYARHVTEKLRLPQGAKILEIASNDGVLLRPLRELGFTCVGVEPALNLCEKSRAEGFEVYPDFFTIPFARKLKSLHGSFDAVFINNALAHSCYTKDIVTGAAELLSPTGFFVFENAYWLRNIQRLYFGQVYHEHWHYFSVKPLVELFKSVGMTFFDLEEIDFQDGSIRGYVSKSPSPLSEKINLCLHEEESENLYKKSYYDSLLQKLESIRDQLQKLLNSIQKEGKTVCIYGCPAKLTTMLEFFKITDGIEYVIEDSQVKQGYLTPSGQFPIFGPEHFENHPTDYAILGATNFAEFIRKRNPQYPGKWIQILPDVQVL